MPGCAGGLSQPSILTAQARVRPIGKCRAAQSKSREEHCSAVPRGSAHCPLAPDGEHRPYLISGSRARAMAI